MFNTHRFLVPFASLAGVLSLIGTGFSAWIFVGDNKPVTFNANASIQVGELALAGRMCLIAEEEARKELNIDLYNYNLDAETMAKLRELVEYYSFRKIVFTEGTPGSTALDDGMQFYRFYHDNYLNARTFKRESFISGKFIIDKEFVDTNGERFDIGLKSVNIDAQGTYALDHEIIDDYIKVGPNFIPNKENSNTFTFEDTTYLSIKNSSFFEWKKSDEIVQVTPLGSTISIPHYEYTFKIDLNSMFLYEEGKKPYNRASVQAIQDAINHCRNHDVDNFDDHWGIQFKMASVII